MSNANKKEDSQPTPRAAVAIWLLVVFAGALSLLGCNTGGEDDVKIHSNSDTDVDTDTDVDGDTDTDSDTDTDVDTDTDSDTDTDDVRVEDPYHTALVVTSDFQTGAYSTISLNDHKVNKDIDFIHSDTVCHFDPLTDTPFLIMRLGSDAVDVLDPDTFEILHEYSVEPMSNPQDIEVVAEGKAFITRFALPEMLIVNPMSGAEIGTVDLSAYADADGIPEVSGLTGMDGKLYANVSRLDRENYWSPAGDSYVVIIDAATGKVDKGIKLAGTNPIGAPEYSKALGKLVVAQAGSYGTLDDGGVQLLDPTTGTAGDFVITEAILGGSLNKTVCVTETKCYSIIGAASDNGSNTHIVSFDPQTGQKTGTLLEGSGWVYGDMALTPDNSELWIADRTAENSGVRIFSTATDTEVTPEPIRVGLPPSAICFTR